MKLKRTFLSMVMAVMLIMFIIPGKVFAADELYLGVTPLKTNDKNGNDYFGYSIGGQPVANETEAADSPAARIWNIQEYTGMGENDTLKATGNKNIYCLKSGVGFGSLGKREVYNFSKNMKTQRDEIKNKNTTLQSIVDGTIPYGDTNVSKYNALLALCDMLYLIDESSDEEKLNLLEEAGIRSSEWNAFLTRDDISAVQQAAIWYFTNYGENNNKYDHTGDSTWLYYTTTGEIDSYKTLSDYKRNDGNDGLQREQQANLLYNYLINTAKANANNYSDSTDITTITAPVKVTTTKLNYEVSGSNYIVGPIHIDKVEEVNIPYTIDFDVNIQQRTILNSNKQPVSEGTTIKDLVGQDFYISVSTNDVENIEVSIDIKYSTNTLTLWASTNNNLAQPVLLPNKVEHVDPIKLTVKPEKREFDLALRKYITKVTSNGTTRVLNSPEDTRAPKVEESVLTTDTTASYKHRKDPVAVETGDIVTYEIRIYNEGEKAGRATQVIDQLPAGLKFNNNVVSGNFDADSSYNYEGDNKLILNRKANNTTNLPAYETDNFKKGIGFETIEIECEVMATADSKNKTVLTNIAWISEEYDAETDTPYSRSEIGYDRDSAPGAHPEYNKENMTNYHGSTDKALISDTGRGYSDYYYKGQQDDDDFEKLVLEPETFDLKLIKNITEVNGKAVTDRIKSIDVSRLNATTNPKTTADYKLDKNPVSVAKGDIVTYRLRVYNEGTLDGYASEITEDIPEGLQFIFVPEGTQATDAEKAASDFNMENGWSYVDSTDEGLRKIRTTKLALYPEINGQPDTTAHTDNLIKAFGKNSGTKTSNDLKYKDVFVKMKVVSDNLTGITIRNEACISKDSDKNGNEIDDRDSTPEEWKKEDSSESYDDDGNWKIYKEDDEDYDNIILKPFDLALRKFIVAVSDNETIEDSEWLKTGTKYTREPNVDTTKLNTTENGRLITTATYEHPKQALEVKKGNIVVYMLRVYNEGDIAGYATEIKDHLPSNLEYVDGEFNRQRGWSVSEDGRTVTTRYLENQLIKAAQPIDGGSQPYSLSFKEVPIMCKVKSTAKVDEKITNIADITEFKDENKQPITDRDSQEDNVNTTDGNKPEYKDTEINRGDKYIPGQQDDDDFEKVIVPAKVDLALTKFITAISEEQKIEDGEYLSKDKTSKDAGSAKNPYDRQTAVDTKELRDNEECHDATYIQDKTPLVVGINSYVLYNIRVYNEGEVDVYAGEVTDFLPENLEFVDGEFNKQYGWTAEGRTVKTSYLSSKNGTDKILKAFDKENDDGNGSGLDYKDLPILCKVNSKTPSGKKLINTAEITKYEDKDGNNLPEDVDSTPDNVNPKNVEDRQEDDDDYEVVLVKKVDLALTKFITAISKDTNIEDGEYLTKDTTSKNAGSAENPYDRQTAVDTKELRDNEECHDATYIQDKTPIIVGRDSYVLYNIRVYNEGSEDVYAGEVTDFLPENLEFVDGEFNKQYGWTADGRIVKTSYLSSKNGEDKILKAFDKENDDGKGSGLDYKDLPILCKVNSNTPANKELINTAEITKYEDEDGKDLPKDIDSIPDNVKTRNDKDREEDDDDYEVVVVKEFDLALRKWVTQAIVIDSKGQTVTETGHQPYDDPEQVVKVELHRKKLNEVTVKFRYSIRVINEGDIAGYAKEVTDYIPEGLKFVQEDNKGWTDEGNNVISTTLLEDTLLQPGEYADVEVLLTWINNENNMGVMVNTAEISKDYNEYGVPDRDSIPDNKKPGEDDIDDAPVMLSISTGQMRIYFVLGFAVLITIAGGVVLIKKYVL